MLTLSYRGAVMQVVVQYGERCGKFLDISFQEPSNFRYLPPQIFTVAGKIPRCLQFGFRARKESCGG